MPLSKSVLAFRRISSGAQSRRTCLSSLIGSFINSPPAGFFLFPRNLRHARAGYAHRRLETLRQTTTNGILRRSFLLVRRSLWMLPRSIEVPPRQALVKPALFIFQGVPSERVFLTTPAAALGKALKGLPQSTSMLLDQAPETALMFSSRFMSEVFDEILQCSRHPPYRTYFPYTLFRFD